MKLKDSYRKGYLFAITDMAVFGLLPVVSHYLVSTLDPFLFSGLATFIGGIPLLLTLRKNFEYKKLYKGDYVKPLIVIGVLSAISSLLFFGGTKLTSGLNTGLLIQTEPFYALILGLLILKEVFDLKQFIATLIMVIGAIIIVFKGLTSINLGDIFILITPLVNQISHLFAKGVMEKTNNSNLVAAARLLYSGILLLIFALAFNFDAISQLFNIKNLVIIVLFGLIFRSLDFYLWYGAIKLVPISKASAVLPLAVAFSFLGSVFFLKEEVTAKQYYGLIFILGGLIWLSIIHFKTRTEKTSQLPQ